MGVPAVPLRVAVRVTPKGGRDAVDGTGRDANGRPYLKVRVRAAPDAGNANAALLAVLAREFGLPRTSLRIASGHASRMKIVEIAGGDALLRARLAPLGKGS